MSAQTTPVAEDKPPEPLQVDASVELQQGQLTATPRSALTVHPKVAGGMVGTWVAIILLWVLHTYAGITPPGEVDAAIAGLISFVVGYLIPSN